MHGRIGYRHILPIANFVLFVTLISIGYTGLFKSVRAFHEIQQTISGSAAMEGSWDPLYFDSPRPYTHVFAEAMNYPAMLLAIPFGLVASGWRSDIAVHIAAAVFLLVLWYGVGLWFDRRRNPASPRPATPMIHGLRWLAVFVSGLGCVALLVLFVAKGPAAVRTGDWLELLLSVPVLFWPAFTAYASWREVHSERVLTATESQ